MEIIHIESALSSLLWVIPALIIVAQTFAMVLLVRQRRSILSTQKSLRDSEKRWKFAIEGSGDGLWDWDIPTGYTFYSSRWKKMLGYGEKEINSSIEEWRSRVHPDDMESCLRGHALVFERKAEFYQNTYRLRTKSGTYRWIHSRGMVVEWMEDGRPRRMIGTHSDITDKVNTEKALDESLMMMKTQFENSPDLIVIADWDNRIEMINKSLDDDIPPSSLKGLHLKDAFPQVCHDPVGNAIRKCYATSARQEVEYELGDGRYVHARIVPLIRSDRVERIMIISTDITEKKKAQEYEGIMQEQMLHADRMNSLGLLVSGVAHEINNPNQYILSNIRYLSDAWKSVTPILDEYFADNGDFLAGGVSYCDTGREIAGRFDKVLSGAQRIALIVDELKSFARRDDRMDITDIDINQTVLSALELSRGMIRKATDHFVESLEEGLPQVRASRSRVEQVVINLIQNACQALTSRSQAIHITTGITPDGRIFITVADQGKGIEEKDMRNIAVPFFTTKREQGGTGLGLYVSRNIIQSLGGTMGFYSKPGEGTSVTVALPHLAN